MSDASSRSPTVRAPSTAVAAAFSVNDNDEPVGVIAGASLTAVTSTSRVAGALVAVPSVTVIVTVRVAVKGSSLVST